MGNDHAWVKRHGSVTDRKGSVADAKYNRLQRTKTETAAPRLGGPAEAERLSAGVAHHSYHGRMCPHLLFFLGGGGGGVRDNGGHCISRRSSIGWRQMGQLWLL